MLSMIGRDSVPLNVHSIPWSVSPSLTCLSVVNLVSSFTILAENACLSPSTNNPDSLQRCFMTDCDDFISSLLLRAMMMLFLSGTLVTEKRVLEHANICSCIVEARMRPRDVHIRECSHIISDAHLWYQRSTISGLHSIYVQQPLITHATGRASAHLLLA